MGDCLWRSPAASAAALISLVASGAGTLTRSDFINLLNPLRAGFKAELEAATALPIAHAEKTPLAKTIHTCQQLLQVEPALWTIVLSLLKLDH